MKAALLDRRITIQRATVVTNDFGEQVQTWADLAAVWASKEEIRDSERFASGEVAADRTDRFRIRYSARVADVNPKDRVVYGDRTFGIVAVKEIGRREGLEITATARAE